MENIEKYVKDGKVAILLSGSKFGWSTRNGYPGLSYDKRVIEYYLEHKDDRDFMCNIVGYPPLIRREQKYFDSIGYKDVSFLGFRNMSLVFLDIGTRYRIEKIDGFERLITQDSIPWDVA